MKTKTIEKVLTDKQSALLAVIKNLPKEKSFKEKGVIKGKGVIITTAKAIAEATSKKYRLSTPYTHAAIRTLVAEKLLKSAEAIYCKNAVGRRIKITL